MNSIKLETRIPTWVDLFRHAYAERGRCTLLNSLLLCAWMHFKVEGVGRADSFISGTNSGGYCYEGNWKCEMVWAAWKNFHFLKIIYDCTHISIAVAIHFLTQMYCPLCWQLPIVCACLILSLDEYFYVMASRILFFISFWISVESYELQCACSQLKLDPYRKQLILWYSC